MFNDVTSRYDLTDASWEIAIMLLGAFLLGWLLHHFMHCKSKKNIDTTSQQFGTTDSTTSAGSSTNDILPAATDTTINPMASFSDLDQIDDLKVVEGIGPKIESLLHAAGITSMRGLAIAHTDVIKKTLDDAGPRFRMHDPKTWSTQAELIADEKWDELKEYQDFLSGGKHA